MPSTDVAVAKKVDNKSRRRKKRRTAEVSDSDPSSSSSSSAESEAENDVGIEEEEHDTDEHIDASTESTSAHEVLTKETRENLNNIKFTISEFSKRRMTKSIHAIDLNKVEETLKDGEQYLQNIIESNAQGLTDESAGIDNSSIGMSLIEIAQTLRKSSSIFNVESFQDSKLNI